VEAQEIEVYLADLGQELQDIGVEEPVRILMIGGAFMLTQVHNRSTMQDVDVLLKDIDDPTVSPLYQTFRTAVQAVASRNQLSIT
jgi:ATP phosphoribosyltransferase